MTAVRLPWAVLQLFPVLNSVAPSRIALFVVLMAAVIIARGLDSLPPRWFPAGAGATAIALAPLLPVIPYRPAPVSVPSFFTSRAVDVIPQNGLVLAVPIPAPGQPQAMAWAAASHIRFRLIGCYCIVPRRDGHPSFYPPLSPLVSLVLHISSGLIDTPAIVPPQVVADLRELAPAAVILGPSPRGAQLRLLFDRLLGPPTTHTGDVTVWLTARSASAHSHTGG